MKTIAIAALAGTAALAGLSAGTALHGEGGPSNGAEHRSYAVGSFDGVSQVGGNHVLVQVGPAISVRAEGPRETLDRYEVVVEHGSLEIKPKREHHWNDGDRFWRDVKPATFYVTLPRLTAISTAGSGDVRADQVRGAHFTASVAGAGGIDVASLEVEQAEFSLAGAGNLAARGKAHAVRVSIAGSGDVKARGLTSDDASVSIVGSGNTALTVRNAAHISLTGSGSADIAGSARCTVSRMGSGTAHCASVATTRG